MQYLKAILANPQIVAAIVALSGVLIGLIGVVSGWVLAVINSRYDERRHLRQLAIETAVVYWKQDIELAKIKAQSDPSRRVLLSPLDTYIVHMLLLSKLITRKNITEENIEAELTRITAISSAARRSAEKRDNK